MFQSSHDSSDKHLKLETLAARVINPLLGTKGLYVRSEVKQQYQPTEKKNTERFSTNLSSVESSPETQRKSILSSKVSILKYDEYIDNPVNIL